ncbi:25790_t:CDS:2, partial [Gigaspora rosea]
EEEGCLTEIFESCDTLNKSAAVTNKDHEQYTSIYQLPLGEIHTWNNKVPEYKFEENDSDANDIIDEVRRQTRIKKDKMKPTVVKCRADLAGNTYLKEEDSKTDLRSYICNDGLEKEETEIRDLFNYYYGEENKRRNTYNLGSLNPM